MPLKPYKWTKILFSLEHAEIVESRPFPKETNDTPHMLGGRVFVKLVQKVSKLKTNDGQLTQCLKITEKVSFNIASNASYVYILSGQKLGN